MEEKEYKRLLNKAAAYCAKAEKSPKEVLNKLYQWSGGEVDEEAIERIMSRLAEEKFVDERRYTEKYIGEKVNLLHKGPYMLSQELSQKGIPPHIIRDQLGAVSDEEWQEALRAYLSPKVEAFRRKSKNAFDLRMRLSRAANGRGFSSSTIDAILNTFDLSVNGTNEDDDYYD